MKFHRSPARRQGGFIQGTILFALAILGVIIAAFAVSNTGSSTNTETERDRVNAGVVLKAGSDLQDGYSRAMGDNWQAKDTDLSGATETDPAGGVTLYLFDPAYKYAVSPRLPDQAFTSGTAGTFTVTDEHTGLGNSSQERVVEVTGLKVNVCRRINNLVLGTPWNATAIVPDETDARTNVSASEGCYCTTADTAPCTYYRVVAVDSGT